MDTKLNAREALREALQAALDRCCGKPMRWGKDDCALFAANVIRDALGVDPAAGFRGTYRSRRGAVEAMVNGSLEQSLGYAAVRCGWTQCAPTDADVGDVGMIDNPVRAIVICRAPGWFVGRNESGFTAIPARHVARCWSVVVGEC